MCECTGLFPISLAQPGWPFGGSRVKPYIEAGVSFERLGGYLVTFRMLGGPPSDQPGISTTRHERVSPQAELKLPVVRISPGFRFSHWGDRFSVPSTKVADFLVGITFCNGRYSHFAVLGARFPS